MSRQNSVSDGDTSCLSRHSLRLLDTDNNYSFVHAKCGVAIIINNINFSPESDIPVRKRAENDHKRLEAVFRVLNFKVDICLDLTADDMVDKMREAACNINYDHTAADCFACAVLSHGSNVVDENGVARDVLLGVDGKPVYTRDLLSPFKDETCPYLHGKPKLFFIESCHESDNGQDVSDSTHVDTEGQISPNEGSARRKLEEEALQARLRKLQVNNDPTDGRTVSPTPLFKDFLVMYAAPPGYSTKRGKTASVFVENLEEVFLKDQLPDLPLVRLLARVCRKVSESSESPKDEISVEKALSPCVMSMLTKDLYFKR